MGFGMAGIGMSVMHDANHGSYSKSKTVNLIMGYLIHFIGGSAKVEAPAQCASSFLHEHLRYG